MSPDERGEAKIPKREFVPVEQGMVGLFFTGAGEFISGGPGGVGLSFLGTGGGTVRVLPLVLVATGEDFIGCFERGITGKRSGVTVRDAR